MRSISILFGLQSQTEALYSQMTLRQTGRTPSFLRPMRCSPLPWGRMVSQTPHLSSLYFHCLRWSGNLASNSQTKKITKRKHKARTRKAGKQGSWEKGGRGYRRGRNSHCCGALSGLCRELGVVRGFPLKGQVGPHWSLCQAALSTLCLLRHKLVLIRAAALKRKADSSARALHPKPISLHRLRRELLPVRALPIKGKPRL